ncbi:MAG: hypothetical protein IPM13_01195 [Phycisphaerales bacterium]|nr:hypothetical protein [Phycisphaerales bacterium]
MQIAPTAGDAIVLRADWRIARLARSTERIDAWNGVCQSGDICAMDVNASVVACLACDGTVLVHRVSDGSVAWSTRIAAGPLRRAEACLRVLDGGDTVVVAHHKGIAITRRAGRPASLALERAALPPTAIAVAPDGDECVVVVDDVGTCVVRVDLAAGLIRAQHALPIMIAAVAYRSSSEVLLAGLGRLWGSPLPGAVLLDLDSGTVTPLPFESGALSVAMAPNGSVAYIGAVDGCVYEVDLERRELILVHRLFREDEFVEALALDDGASALLCGSSKGQIRRLTISR